MKAARCLSDVVEFDPDDNEEEGEEDDAVAKEEHGIKRGAEGTREGEEGTLRVVAGRDYDAGEQFFILYGQYSNAKLLYR